MTETTYTEKRAIRDVMAEVGDAVVIGPVDMDIADYFHELEDAGPEVNVWADSFSADGIEVPAKIIRAIDKDGYEETGEPLGVVVSAGDYERLGRE